MYDQSLSPCHIFSKELLIQCYKSISDFLYNINPSFIKRGYIIEGWKKPKIGCVFLIVVVSMFPHAEIGQNDHREGAPHFIEIGNVT